MVSAAVDISVEHIEVTQGIQDDCNSVPLVTGRTAAVRVTVKTNQTVEVPGIKGKLAVLVEGNPIPGSPFSPLPFSPTIVPFTAPGVADPEMEHHTLNFELTSDEFLKIPEGVPVEFHVTLDPLEMGGVTETELADNSKTLGPLVFMRWRIRPWIFYSLIDYRPTGLPPLGLPPDPTLVAPGPGETMVRGILPVRDLEKDLYQNPFVDPTKGILFEEHNGAGTIRGGASEGHLFDLLDWTRWILVYLYSLDEEETFLFGWLPKNSINISLPKTHGLSLGRVGFGEVDPLFYQRVFAHEIGHQLGICLHEDRKLLDTPGSRPGWNHGGRLWDNPITNKVKALEQSRNPNGTGRVKWRNYYDVMASGKLTANSWVDVKTYKDLLTPKDMLCPGAADVMPAPAADETAESTVVIRGRIRCDGKQVEELHPVFHYRHPRPSSKQPPSGKYLVEVSDAGGQSTRTRFFDAQSVIEDDRTGAPPSGFFSVAVPFSGKSIGRIRILDAITKDPLHPDVTLAEHPQASVRIVSPTANSTLQGEVPLKWEIIDQKKEVISFKEGFALHAAISPDGGKTWKLLGVNLKSLQVLLDAKKLSGVGKSGLLRVILTDGLNTSVDEVGGLSVR